MNHCKQHIYYRSNCTACRQANQFQASSTDDGLADDGLNALGTTLVTELAADEFDTAVQSDASVPDSTGFSDFDGGNFGGGGAGGDF